MDKKVYHIPFGTCVFKRQHIAKASHLIFHEISKREEHANDMCNLPPFTITETTTNLIIEIGEMVGRITEKEDFSVNPKLLRSSRIKTIYSSLAIEQNTMSLEQVSDVIDGKKVLAPPKESREMKNAYEAYEELQKMNPYSIEDLLKAHRFMMWWSRREHSGVGEPVYMPESGLSMQGLRQGIQ